MAKKIIIYGRVPSKSNSYKLGKMKSKLGQPCFMYKAKGLTKYEEDFYIQLPPEIRGININKWFKLEVDIYYPSKRLDLDNSLKIILDCLENSKVIKNDNLCARIEASKAIDKKNPRIEFMIKQII